MMRKARIRPMMKAPPRTREKRAGKESGMEEEFWLPSSPLFGVVKEEESASGVVILLVCSVV
jgi:hypothetical protein